VAFQNQLDPLILNVHGESEHKGKRPRRATGSSELRTQLIRLRREMKEAVESENYERASELRDRIRNIETEQAP
jgi:protein arginine kinase activator